MLRVFHVHTLFNSGLSSISQLSQPSSLFSALGKPSTAEHQGSKTRASPRGQTNQKDQCGWTQKPVPMACTASSGSLPWLGTLVAAPPFLSLTWCLGLWQQREGGLVLVPRLGSRRLKIRRTGTQCELETILALVSWLPAPCHVLYNVTCFLLLPSQTSPNPTA